MTDEPPDEGRPPNSPIICTSFRPWRSNSLIGYCDLYVVNWKLHVYGCTCHEHVASRRRWVQLAGRPCLTRDNELLRNERGKIVYAPTLKFDDLDLLRRFSDKAAAAVAEAFPDAFSPFPDPDDDDEQRLL